MCTLCVRKTYHREDDGRDDKPCGYGIGAVDVLLPPHEGEGRGKLWAEYSGRGPYVPT